jgi:tripartite-type tricarboxylate transporter receptor subunit TctC
MLGISKHLSFSLVFFFGSAACAQDYPVKPIKIVAPFAPGSATDYLSRLLGSHLSAIFGQQIITDNRPGVGGAIGTEYVAKQPPDGYTLLLGSQGPMVISPALQQNLKYNTISDFVPVSALVWTPHVFVVRPDSQIKDIKTLVQMAKEKPNSILYGSGGSGSSQHLTVSNFATAAHIELTHVPYKGSVAAITELIGGATTFLSDTATVVLPYLANGKLRAIGVVPSTRIAQLPDVPTIMEQGVPLSNNGWNFMFAPVGTPNAIVVKLDTEIRKVLARADIKKVLFDQGYTIMEMPREEIAEYIKAEVPKWRKIVAASGAKIE